MKHVFAHWIFNGKAAAMAALVVSASLCVATAFGDKPAEAVRAARSVHLWYDPSMREKATGVQATMTVRDTVPGTYFCVACFFAQSDEGSFHGGQLVLARNIRRTGSGRLDAFHGRRHARPLKSAEQAHGRSAGRSLKRRGFSTPERNWRMIAGCRLLNPRH